MLSPPIFNDSPEETPHDCTDPTGNASAAVHGNLGGEVGLSDDVRTLHHVVENIILVKCTPKLNRTGSPSIHFDEFCWCF